MVRFFGCKWPERGTCWLAFTRGSCFWSFNVEGEKVLVGWWLSFWDSVFSLLSLISTFFSCRASLCHLQIYISRGILTFCNLGNSLLELFLRPGKEGYSNGQVLGFIFLPFDEEGKASWLKSLRGPCKV